MVYWNIYQVHVFFMMVYCFIFDADTDTVSRGLNVMVLGGWFMGVEKCVLVDVGVFFEIGLTMFYYELLMSAYTSRYYL